MRKAEEVGAIFDNPLALGVILLVLLLVFLGVRAVRKRERKIQDGFIPGMDELLKAGNYQQAALIAQRHGKDDLAIEYYLRAQEPLRAAQIAARGKNARKAAELYERGGDLERAAALYAEVGMTDVANQLRESLAKGKQSLGPRDEPVEKLASIQPPTLTKMSEAETRFREALAKVTEDVAERARLQELGSEAAEQLLREGQIRRAAEVYRDAGLVDEAVHLYVNVIGAPGEAASLLAARGNHARAAELFELAGKLERAAALWVEVARTASQPELYVERIERLSEEIACGFLEEVTVSRPLSPETVALHYLRGRALERKGDAQRALTVYQAVEARVADYRDVRERIAAIPLLRSTAKEPSVSPPKSSSQDSGLAGSKALGQATQIDPATDRTMPALYDQRGPSQANDTELGPRRVDLPQEGTSRQPNLPLEQLSQIAQQAAAAAIEHARRGGLFAPLATMPSASVGSRAAVRTAQPRVVVVGLETQPLQIDVLNDSARYAARVGPSIASLLRFIGDKPCELQNIEVFYRLGLAYLAEGKWEEALRAFDAVEEASPGYRDAEKRADQLRGWQKAVGPRLSVTKASGPSQQPTSRYRIHGELGRGGMAVVYRATDEVLGRDVALKFLAEELSTRAEMHELFQREARAVAQLNHPNIITLYDYGVIEGKAFICMEYVEGTSLEHSIDQQGRLTVVESLRITLQVLDALDYAHSRNIIHRDIKPSNIMRAKSGLAKLMDFGLAKSIAAGAKASIIAGTPAYMPPEQFAGGAVDARSDLFAVGCSLYEMLTAALPFEGSDRSVRAKNLQEHDTLVPEAVNAIVQRALELDPGKRFQTAKELALPIRHILEAVDRYNAGESLPALTLQSAGVETVQTQVDPQPREGTYKLGRGGSRLLD